MNSLIHSIITASGIYLPREKICNTDFLEHEFYDPKGIRLQKTNTEIVQNFSKITDIQVRRYVKEDLKTSDIGYLAAQNALDSSGIDKEELDYIILAHNFGDTSCCNNRIDILPSLASRVKRKLKIENPNTVAFDVIFGCPGWLHGMIQADYYIKSGDAKKVMVIGAEVMSRISDPHDRDSLIYADGAGAVILEARKGEGAQGILAHCTRSDTIDHGHLLKMGNSYNTEYGNKDLFLKMEGKRLYQYALRKVPAAIKQCIDKSGLAITDISKLLIHQANGKMDWAIKNRLYSLYGIKDSPDDVMPMTVSWLGNSSVATVPILYDLLMKNQLENHQVKSGENIVFASVGAGMNINAAVYRIP